MLSLSRVSVSFVLVVVLAVVIFCMLGVDWVEIAGNPHGVVDFLTKTSNSNNTNSSISSSTTKPTYCRPKPKPPTLTRKDLRETCDKVLKVSQQSFEEQTTTLNCIQLVRSIQTWTEPHLSMLRRSSEEEETNDNLATKNDDDDDDYFEEEDESLWSTPVLVAGRRLLRRWWGDHDTRRPRRRVYTVDETDDEGGACQDLEEDLQSSSSSNTSSLPKASLFLHRLANKIKKATAAAAAAESQPAGMHTNTSSSINGTTTTIKILILGGSMTAGSGLKERKKQAWPAHLSDMLNYDNNNNNSSKNESSSSSSTPISPGYSFEIVNMAGGGANEQRWLNLFRKVAENAHDDLDIVLLESSVNDQCNFDQIEKQSQQVDELSNKLLRKLLHDLPSQPAVMTIEMFRTASGKIKDAQIHCPGHIMALLSDDDDGVNNNSTPYYYYCPQWWMPQDWRQNALAANKVPIVSYRDAVWPVLEKPPKKLQPYWDGLSHPREGSHHLVATTIYFGLQVLIDNLQFFLESTTTTEDAADDMIEVMLDEEEDEFCGSGPLVFEHQPELEDDDDGTHYNLTERIADINRNQATARGKNWVFGTDSKPIERLDRYGWIYEEERGQSTTVDNNNNNDDAVFRLNVKVGGQGKIVLTRLVSYDSRMADAMVWFSSSSNTTSASAGSSSGAATSENKNVFPNDLKWNVSSWHEDHTSIPEDQTLLLPKTFSNESGLSWPAAATAAGGDETTISLTMNVAVVAGSSKNSTIDKFKLLSIQTC